MSKQVNDAIKSVCEEIEFSNITEDRDIPPIFRLKFRGSP